MRVADDQRSPRLHPVDVAVAVDVDQLGPLAPHDEDRVAAATPDLEDRAILYSSTEFKKIRLLYFTDDFRAWEREHAGA